jgi:hypothetical protein
MQTLIYATLWTINVIAIVAKPMLYIASALLLMGLCATQMPDGFTP